MYLLLLYFNIEFWFLSYIGPSFNKDNLYHTMVSCFFMIFYFSGLKLTVNCVSPHLLNGLILIPITIITGKSNNRPTKIQCFTHEAGSRNVQNSSRNIKNIE